MSRPTFPFEVKSRDVWAIALPASVLHNGMLESVVVFRALERRKAEVFEG